MAALLSRWPLVALSASTAALAVAHASQAFGGLAPCELCLKQREVYWVAMVIAAVGLGAPYTRWPQGFRRAVCALLAAVFLFGAGLAAYHAGVEWKLWPGPATCTGAGTVSVADMAAILKGARLAAPMCDKPAIVILGLSMAGWNALASAALAALSLAAALARRA
jgi:disulfide bond formation protein DsbB